MWGAVAKGIGGAIVGEVAVNLALNTNVFNKDVKDSVKSTEKSYSNAFSSIGKSGSEMFSKLGKLAVASGLVAGVVKFTKSALQLGSDLQEVQNVVDVTFGSMSSKVNEFANNTIETAGLSETVAKKYMGTFGAMNKQFGFTTEQSYEMSKAITQLTGDVASFYNLSSAEAYTKLKSIWTGETETLKEIGVVMTQNALDQYALANGYGKTTSAMTEQEKVALRYAFVQDKLSLANGDFIRTQDGWANSTRVLSLRWQQFMATVGQGLINVLTPLVKMLNLLMSKLQGYANSFKNFTASLFGDANAGGGSSGTSSTLTNINDGLSGIGTSASDSADEVASASKKIQRSLSKVDELNIINSNKDTTGGTGSSGLGNLGSGSYISDIGSLDVSNEVNGTGGAISKLADKIKELIKPLQDIDFTNLKNGLDKVYKALKPITKKLGEGLEWIWYNILVPLAKWTIEDAVPSFLNAVAGALDFLNGVTDIAKPYLQYLWEEFLLPIRKWTGGVIVDVLDWIGDKLSVIGKWMSEHAPDIKDIRKELEPFSDLFKEYGKAWKTIMGLKWEWFTTKLEFLWNYVLKPIWDYLLYPLLVQFWSRLKGLAEILGGIFEAFNKLMEGDWKGAGQSIVDGLVDGLTEIWEGSFIKKYLYDPIVDGFKKLFGIHSPSTVFYDFGINIIQGLGNGLIAVKEWLLGKWNTVKSWFTEIKVKVSNWFATKKQDVSNWWSNVQTWWGDKKLSIKNKFESTRSTVSGWWNNIKSWWGDKTLSLKVKIGEVIGSIKGWINTNFIDKVNKKLPSFFPKIPRLFNGGYLPANNPQLAIVGDNKREAEIVTPESKIYDQTMKAIKDSGGAGGKQEIEITIYHKYEDGRTIIQKVNQAQIDAGEVLLLT